MQERLDIVLGARFDDSPEKVAKFRQELADLAYCEAMNEFPVMHAHATASLWNGLESLIQSWAAQWIINKPEILLNKPWSQLKTRLGDYLALDSEQRAYYLVELLEQTLGSPLKQGINRFESVIAAIGISGAVPPDVSDVLFQLQQVRNVIVHKRSIADKRLCCACPSMKLSPGEPLRISNEQFHIYLKATSEYVGNLTERTVDYFKRQG